MYFCPDNQVMKPRKVLFVKMSNNGFKDVQELFLNDLKLEILS